MLDQEDSVGVHHLEGGWGKKRACGLTGGGVQEGDVPPFTWELMTPSIST